MKGNVKNKYRTTSTRAQWWDYGWNGAYFITICTRNREHFFGEIDNGKMNLSKAGKKAEELWQEIPNQFTYTALCKFVVMPNHVHGILLLDKPEKMIVDSPIVETRLIASLQSVNHAGAGGFAGNKNP